MTSGLDLVNNLNDLAISLTDGIHQMAAYGKKYAEAEATYKVRLMQESLRLKSEGMAVTLIDKVVYGICAEERQKRDEALAYYKTAQEKINAIKLRMRPLDAQIAREWSKED